MIAFVPFLPFLAFLAFTTDDAVVAVAASIFVEAAFHGLIRDVDLTWDGGHALPRACEGLHVVEFHARGKIVRETVQESAVTDFWRTDAECITAIRRAVHALKALYEANMVGIESEST